MLQRCYKERIVSTNKSRKTTMLQLPKLKIFNLSSNNVPCANRDTMCLDIYVILISESFKVRVPNRVQELHKIKARN